MPVNRFVTIFFAVLHPPTGVLNYVRAGHVPGLLLDGRGEVVELSGPGLAMGVSEHTAFESSLEEGQAVIPYNGALILYSWGVVEAPNVKRRPFGLDGIKEVVRANANHSSHGIIDVLTKALRTHAQGATQLDDWTIVVLKRGAL
jgi:sigma-B regulation protein RsbU (phosphoserine phosphatase)